jgi:phosphatidylinositol alpha-mannosyltransferase
MDRSRILSAGYGLAQTALEKITARIAVSELARNTIVEHVGGDAVLIPNGVHIKNFENVEPFNGIRNPQQIAFLGRLEEPRKGFAILLEAFVKLAPEFPQLSLVVAGPGDGTQATKDVPEEIKQRIEFLGRVTDLDKARMLRSSGVYVAPNTGGESFGIVLLEAMACRTPVIASDLPAFMRVLDYGQSGLLFANESVDELVIALRKFLQNPDIAEGLAESGFQRVQEFDWSRVASQILDVYATVVEGSGPVQEDLRGQIVGRLAPDSQ